MTLAALTPLVTWWPLFFGLLVLIAKVVCPRIVRRQSTTADWPPPWNWEGLPVTYGVLVYDDTIGDPWGPPSAEDRKQGTAWKPEVHAWYMAQPFLPPWPHTRVGA